MTDVSHELGALRHVVDSPLSSKVAMFNNQAQQHKQGQLLNPFSGSHDRSSSPKPNIPRDQYGKPLAGSMTEMRGQKANMHVLREMLELCQIINSEGYDVKDESSMRVIPFGELFNIYNYISDKVVGLLLRARKHNFVEFEGEMLFQRRDDNVPIFLLRPIKEIRAEIDTKIADIKRATSPAPPQSTSVLLDKASHQQKLLDSGLVVPGGANGKSMKSRTPSPAAGKGASSAAASPAASKSSSPISSKAASPAPPEVIAVAPPAAVIEAPPTVEAVDTAPAVTAPEILIQTENIDADLVSATVESTSLSSPEVTEQQEPTVVTAAAAVDSQIDEHLETETVLGAEQSESVESSEKEQQASVVEKASETEEAPADNNATSNENEKPNAVTELPTVVVEVTGVYERSNDEVGSTTAELDAVATTTSPTVVSQEEAQSV